MPATDGEINAMSIGALVGGVLGAHLLANDESVSLKEKMALSVLYVPAAAAAGAIGNLFMHMSWPASSIIIAAPIGVYLLSSLYGKTQKKYFP